jgi:hypothetical protein
MIAPPAAVRHAVDDRTVEIGSPILRSTEPGSVANFAQEVMKGQ